MKDQLKNLFPDAAKDVLTDETLTAISEAIEAKVKDVAEEKIKLTVESALVQQDAEYAEKLEKFVEALDIDHAKKVERLVQKLDENYTEKLLHVKGLYENKFEKDAELFKEETVKKLSKYVKVYLEKSIPRTDLKEAVANTKAKKVLKTIREMVMVDEESVSKEVRDALIDAKNQINESKKLIDGLKKEKTQLLTENKKINSKMLLEQKTAKLPKEKRDYIYKVLGDKDARFINENFSYTLELFEKNDDDFRTLLKEDAEKGSVSKSLNPPKRSETHGLINESPTNEDAEMDLYLEELKR